MQTTTSAGASEQRAARSGSIYERDLDVNGVPKVVIDIHDAVRSDVEDLGMADIDEEGHHGTSETTRLLGGSSEAAKKKKRKRKAKKKNKTGSSSAEGSSSQGASLT